MANKELEKFAEVKGTYTAAFINAGYQEFCRNNIPTQFVCGPLLLLGQGAWYTKFFTKVAFWLLKKAKWFSIKSY